MYALLLIFILATNCDAFQFVSKMYRTLDQTSPCVLRMNGTHTFGCTSPRQGNVGVLQLVHNKTDLNWVLNSSPMDSYIVGIPIDMFSRENLREMTESSKVSGVLVIQDQPRTEIKPLSPEDTCPNRYSGLAAPPLRKNVCESSWNSYGSSILQDRWNIPIFFTKDNGTIVQLQQCFRTNAPYDQSQITRSLCALQLSSHMFGSVDSRTCLRRNDGIFNINPIKYCDEMGDENIYLPIVPLDRFKPVKKSYIVVAARMDASSFFYQNNPASLSVATSLATLLLTAKLLFEMTKGEDMGKYNRNVLFMLFNGEAYDYIGSSRVVYDLGKNQYPSPEQPISKDDIDLYIELSQLHNDSRFIFYHNNTDMSSFATKFQTKLKSAKTVLSSERQSIPPSSMQNFLILNQNLPAVLLSSYNKEFENTHYHSMFDDDYNIKYKYYGRNETVPDTSLQSFLADFATALAGTIYEELVPGSKANVSATIAKEETDELLHCYVNTLACELIKETGLNSFFPDDTYLSKTDQLDYYVGVTRGQSHFITLATKLFLIYYTNNNTKSYAVDECNTVPGRYWLPNKNKCLISLVNFTDARSPAFVIDGYDMTSGQYPTWTESVWTTITVRMFKQPSKRYEWLVCVIGIAVFFSSFAIAYSVKKNAKELFNYPSLITASNI